MQSVNAVLRLKEGDTMTDKPIPMRRRTAEPIKFPPPQTFDQRIRRNIYHILYHVLRSTERVNVDMMSYAEFVATIERMIAEDEA